MMDVYPPPSENYQPHSFRERGLATAFTTPMLAGARVRPAAVGRSLEVIVPNPSGGRGVYVVEWDGVREMCAPTLHDGRLYYALDSHNRQHRAFVPAEIRRLTRHILRQGFAGRPASLAAAAASHASDQLVADTHRGLLIRLAERAESAVGHTQARQELAPIAREDRQDVDAITATVERLAHAVADLGIGAGTAASFVGRTLIELGDLVDAIGSAEPGSSLRTGEAKFIISNAELTLSLARHATDAALARLHDLPRALAEWSRHPAVIQEAVARPEWLLDGWPRICLLSRTMLGQANAAATLAEMAMLVPPIPVQADDWLGLPPGTATRANPPQQGSHGMKLDGARVADLVARNEQLLGMAA